MNSNNFGICQGRLTMPPNGELQWFPQQKWADEFKLANDLGYSFIEFLAERKHNPRNPLWSVNGISKIKKYAEKYSLKIYSICLDYIIDHSIYFGSEYYEETLSYTKEFLNCCKTLDIKLVVLPLLEKSDLNDSSKIKVVPFLKEIKEYIDGYDIVIAIESVAKPITLIDVLEDLNNKKFGCVYDTGNRANKLNNQDQEIITLSKYINHIHLKDKDNNKKNVVLGSGIVDFKKIFLALNKINYKGYYSLETNRGEDPIKTGKNNLNLIEFFINQ